LQTIGAASYGSGRGRTLVDYQVNLYDPVWKVLGTAATIAPDDSPGGIDCTVIDRTSGVTVFEGRAAVETVRPAADIRVQELIDGGLSRNGLAGASVTFNSRTWRVKATLPVPSPLGEDDGILRLILIEP
jgi:hypothetical protein